MPFGETWGSSVADLPTTFAFTGQREAPEIGLMYYVARWYDSTIAHFNQADTIIPSVMNLVSWNRYAYVLYNPLKYTDPSGHLDEYIPEDENGIDIYGHSIEDLYELINSNNEMDETCIRWAIILVAKKLGESLGLHAIKAFSLVYGKITFEKVESYTWNGETYYGGAITLSSNYIQFVSLTHEGFTGETAKLRGTNHIIHELGHAFASSWIGQSAYMKLGYDMNYDELLRREGDLIGHSYGFASGYHFYYYQIACTNASSPNEIFADMFVGYVTGKWFTGQYSTSYGIQMSDIEIRNYIDMADTKSTWINNFMRQLIGN